MSKKEILSKYINIFSWGILAAVIIINFVFIYQNAVNIPFWDEWDLTPHLKHLDLKWLFGFHNEHKIIFTKLITFMLASLNGWDIRIGLVINYIVFVLMVISLYFVLRPASKDCPVLALFFIPLFSTLNSYNLNSLFQSQFHFMILFGNLAIIFGFIKENRIKNTSLFCLFLICSMFSMNIVFSLGIMGCYIFKELANARIPKDTKALLPLIFSVIFFILGLILFFLGPKAPASGGGLVLPNSFYFWAYFSNLFSVGALAGNFNPYLQIFLALITFIMLLQFFLKLNYLSNKPVQGVFALFAATCTSLAAITVARGNLGFNLESRHLEIALLLCPIIASALYRGGKLKKVIFFIYLIILSLNLFKTANYEQHYGFLRSIRNVGKNCVNEFYFNGGVPFCPAIYPREFKTQLIKAKESNLSFTIYGR